MLRKLIGTFVVLAGISYGQLPTSSVTGSVVDPEGLPVAGVKVTVANQGTNVGYETVTTSAGEYVVSGLAPGIYSVAVNQPGFRAFAALGNVLNVGAPLVVNVKLQLGSTSEKVEVEGSYERIDTTSAMISDVIQQRAVQTLPLNGRNPLNLIALEPGIVQGTHSNVNTQVNGGRSNAANLTLDGIDINEISVPNAQKNVYNLNTANVQEFRVVTHNATAEFGKNSGANIAFASRSGSKDFHGDLYEYLRNPDFNANQWYSNAQNIAKPDYKLNQYGADMGGRFPGGKTFWFGSWQGQRFSVDMPGTPTVYTATARAGIFRYVAGTVNGQTKAAPALVDPTTGALLPGIQACGGSVTTNCIASVSLASLGATAATSAGGPYGLDTTMTKFFNATPLPNLYSAGDGLNTAGYGWNRPTKDPQARFMGRIDHNFNKDNSVFFRFIISRDNTALGDPINGTYEAFPGFPSQGTSVRKPANFAVNYRRVLTSHLVNSFAAGVARFQYAFPSDYTNSLFPTIPPYSVSTVTNPFANANTGGLSNQSGLSRTLTTLQALDNLSWEHGAHLVSAGFNFRFQRQNDSRSSVGGIYGAPVVSFSGSVRDPALIMTLPTNISSTDLTNLKNGIDEIMGLASSQSMGYFASSMDSYTPSNLYIRGERMHQYDSYVQDQWRLRSNLSVSLGIRWEFNPPGTEARGLALRPNHRPDIWSASNPVVYSPASQFWDRNNTDALGPRAAIAWNPFGDSRTVIRSGYGIYFDTINTFQLVPFAGVQPGASAACTVQVANTSQKTTAATPTPNCLPAANPTAPISQGYGIGLPQPSVPPSSFLSPAPSAKGVAPQAGEIDPNLKMPTVHEWNLSVQRDLGKSVVLEAAYLGSHGVHLPRGYDLNQLNINNGGYLQSFNTARSNYINCANAAGTATCGQAVGILQQILGSTLTTSTATTPLLNGSAAGLANTIDTTYFSQMVATTGNPGFFRPNPQFGTLLYMDSSSSSSYNAMQVHLRRHESNLDFGVSYTFAKSIDDGSNDPVGSSSSGGVSSTTAPSDIHNFAMDRGRSDFDRTQVLTGYSVWQIPVGHGRKWFPGMPAILNAVVGGWGLSGIVSWMSGEPFTISSGILTADNIRSSRAQIVGPIPSFGLNPSVPGNAGPSWIPPSALPEINPTTSPFAIPAPGSYGNQGRNIFVAPRFFNIDMTLNKHFSIRERWKMELRADAFNVLNHPNFHLASVITAFSGTTVTSPSGQTPLVVQPSGSSSFGSLCCTSASLPSSFSATGVGEPSRVLQVSLTVSF
ncbi:MAG: carboxypeptidase regulatory-like domain-containing protein [Bryobacteraceae bacterium]|jgi:hypothetical protein